MKIKGSVWGVFLLLLAGASAQNQRVLSLRECVSITWDEQPQVFVSERSWRIAEEQVKNIRANLFPQISAGYQFRRFLSTRVGFQFGIGQIRVEEPVELKETSLTLSQMLFDSNQVSLQIRQAKAQANANMFAFEKTKADIALQLSQQFFEVIRAKALVKLQTRVLERAVRLLEATEAGHKAGAVAKLDVLRSQVQVKTAEVDLLSAKNQERLAMLTLRNLMGVGDDFVFDISDQNEEPFTFPDLTECIAQALRWRPEVHESEQQKESFIIAQRLAKISAKPIVNLNGSYNHYLTSSRGIDKEWMLNLTVNYPVFDGGHIKAQLAEAKLKLEQADFNFKLTLDKIRLQVQQAYLNLQNATERRKATQEAVKEASETMRLTEEAYKTGAASLLDVLNAQVALAQAETQEIQAYYDLRKASFALIHAIGKIIAYFENPKEERFINEHR